MKENFRPKAHTPPVGIINTIRFNIRLLLDLQVMSVFKHLKKFIPNVQGKLLDVGCGESPYQFLVNKQQTEYFGVDIADADKFDYNNSNIVHFKGDEIPFADNTFDGIICTEVLEHVFNYQKLVDEMYRVLKPNSQAIITIPWSARYHYIPHDYFRYTPSTLQMMFSEFSDAKIVARGNDITSISAKFIVLFFRNIIPQNVLQFLMIPIWILLIPILILTVLIGQLSLRANIGSDLDPLGYIIFLKK